MPMFFLTVVILKCSVREVMITNEMTVCLFVFFLSRNKKCNVKLLSLSHGPLHEFVRLTVIFNFTRVK